MAEGMFKKPPTGGGLKELSARQQRRKAYLERRGRKFRPGGRVSGQPVDEEGGELTARQQRRRQYLERRDARRERALADWRAQQQAQQQMPSFQPGMALGEFVGQIPEGLDPRTLVTGEIRQDTPGLDVGRPIVPYSPEMTGGFTGQYPEQFGPVNIQPAYDKMLRQLPPGVSQSQVVGAAMQEPMRTPTPEFVNAMPGQLKTGTWTPDGMYRPLPFYATPEQIRQRMALIETGGYFDQPVPARRMR